MSGSGKIGFAGLSHLGIIYSAAAAARGFQVVAFDERPGLAEDLTAGRFPISEPGLAESQRRHGSQIRYTGNAKELAECAVVFLTLDVLTDENNVSHLAPLEVLIERTSASAAPGSVLVIMSQVPPGFCRKLAGRVPQHLQLFYQVETLVFGNALERAIAPERYMVGCADPSAPLPQTYRQYLEAFGCPILAMRYESAELCKIAINCFLVSSVSTANTLAEICEKIGADWREITPALRLDKRIGPHAYLSPGLGIAGGNLERDLVTVQHLAAQHGSDARVVTAWQQNSAYRKDWVLRRLFELGVLQKRGTVLALWGLAYKPDTHSIKNSPSLELARALPGYRFQAYDPQARVGSEFSTVRQCGAPLEAVDGAAALLVMTAWKEFSQISLERVSAAMKGREILDPYGALDGTACRRLGFRYHQLGVQTC